MSVSVDVEWDTTPEELSRSLQKFLDILMDEVERAVGDIALLIEREAKKRAPVDTGTLRASIGHVVNAIGEGYFEAIIGTNVEYAPAVEFGRGPVTADGKALKFTVDGETIFRKSVGPAKAQPFLGPALHAAEGEINDRLQAAVSRAKRRA
ncbi:HK97 gp10 family phage protein [Halopelagius fulvigenes]|uniref:HK97 gp10 family phage protein n=1 Tax=Halopelagius fulvigenes TaxID=1198324 RepID=A0ABD5TYS5_9EURY